MKKASPLSEVEACCADFYQSLAVRFFLGESLHPGGLALTHRLVDKLNLGPGSKVLDIAAGWGSTGIDLAQRFGCRVVGLDLGKTSMETAHIEASRKGLDEKVSFVCGDAKMLPFPSHSFDAILCECSFSAFPMKELAAKEMWRVLRPGGVVGISDITKEGALPQELQGPLSWMLCLGGAKSMQGYKTSLEGAGFSLVKTECHAEALLELIKVIQGKLSLVEGLGRLKMLHLDGLDVAKAKTLLAVAAKSVEEGLLGYDLLVGYK
ncbi:MAG: class I SAM-dependent methyltransferase [Dehalococcoidia bacterium]